MIVNEKGNSVEFKRMDKWVCQLIFKTQCEAGGSCMLTFDFTLDQLREELVLLENSSLENSKQGAENENHT